jgi:hypothetical protein
MWQNFVTSMTKSVCDFETHRITTIKITNLVDLDNIHTNSCIHKVEIEKIFHCVCRIPT